MGYTYQYYTSESTESASDETQIGFGIQALSTTITPALTTTFTPPPECNTPFIYDNFDTTYYAYYPPLLISSFRGNRDPSTFQCLPETTSADGPDGVYKYNPGLFCPEGMTTGTSIGNIFICCHSDLTYSSSQGSEECIGTKTIGVGFTGYDSGEVGIIEGITSFSSADNMTVEVYASPVSLISELVIGSTSTVFFGSMSVASNTPKTSNSPSPSPISSGARAASHTGLKVKASLGAIVLVLILLALGYVLLTRYRRKRLASHCQPSNQPSSTPDRMEAEAILKIRQKRSLPELPMVELRAELDGVQIESRGPGIYVWKPELEGTAGVAGSVGVYVREKAELEANLRSLANSVMEIRPETAPESPIVGSSSGPRYIPTAGPVQTYT
ncbi:hypothetical protein GGR51DRAFT_51056 [Nemania sp. FL0031]|nr:hypothetical protein GGR51DRAFT_51056 [Nemania sp. FL0031]